MKYFTKEWYRAALAEEQQRAAGGKLKFNKKPDNAMRDYQRALSKIQSKLPACVCKTFHGSVITDVAARQDQVVLYFDNSESFSDVEKLVLYDADITCSEGDPVGKTWLHEEVSLADGAFCLAALLGDEQGEEHGGQGVVKAEQFGVGQEVAGHRAYERTEHPAAVGGEVGGVHQRKPRLLTCGHGHAVHGENLVREPPADDELLEAGERREPRGHGGGHEHMPQVDHERRENDGKDGCAHPP